MKPKARGLVSLMCVGALGLLVAACDNGAPEATTAIEPGSTPLTTWRYTAAQAVGTLLAPQKAGVAVLEPTVETSVATELAAALALGPDFDSSAIAQDVAGSFDTKTGLFRENDKASERLTWLAVRWLTSAHGAATQVADGLDRARMVTGLQTRGRTLVQAHISDEASAFAFLNVMRSLELLGARYSGPVPAEGKICSALKDTYTKKNFSAVATWIELSARLQISCQNVMPQEQVAAGISAGAQPGAEQVALRQEVFREYALLTAQSSYGLTVGKPHICADVVAASSPITPPDITADTYLVCADVYRLAGATPHYSSGSTARLEREILWRGRLPASVRFNALAIVQSLYSLRSLQFRDEVLAAVASQEVIPTAPTSTSLDAALVRAARSGATLDQQAQDNLATITPSDDPMYDGMLATLTISAKQCGPAMLTRLLRSTTTASAQDARQLLYQALVAQALGHCGRADAATRVSQGILARVEQLTTSAAPQEIVDVWRLAETRCALSGSPGITEAQVIALLPQPGSETWTGYALFAGVRLTDIVAKGCGSSWWSPAPR